MLAERAGAGAREHRMSQQRVGDVRVAEACLAGVVAGDVLNIQFERGHRADSRTVFGGTSYDDKPTIIERDWRYLWIVKLNPGSGLLEKGRACTGGGRAATSNKCVRGIARRLWGGVGRAGLLAPFFIRAHLQRRTTG